MLRTLFSYTPFCTCFHTTLPHDMRYSLLVSSLLVLAAALGTSASAVADGPRLIRRTHRLAGPSKTANLTDAQLHAVELTRRPPTRRCRYLLSSDLWRLNDARFVISSDCGPPPALCTSSGDCRASAHDRQPHVHKWEHGRYSWKARCFDQRADIRCQWRWHGGHHNDRHGSPLSSE